MQLERVPVPPPLQAWRLPVGDFPLARDRRDQAKAALRAIMKAIAAEWSADTHFFIQYDAPKIVHETMTANAGRWRLETGLGIWPDRPPPKTPGVLDFIWNAIRQQRPIDYKVYRPGRAGQQDDLFEAIAGLGGFTALACTGGLEPCLGSIREALSSYTQDPIAAGKAFYYPLIDQASLSSGKTPQSLGSAAAYIRESPGDQAILVVTAKPGGALLEGAGLLP